ncbi:hypothetical protein GCM10023215_39040 [Pseudonocardia yuanmonensis]|uniref:Uncharacterized protein n=1 Tax=Pseudonocardia yuanmonensis TaxID=1095914 RepID=A0ABP8WXT9_9PSEU
MRRTATGRAEDNALSPVAKVPSGRLEQKGYSSRALVPHPREQAGVPQGRVAAPDAAGIPALRLVDAPARRVPKGGLSVPSTHPFRLPVRDSGAGAAARGHAR